MTVIEDSRRPRLLLINSFFIVAIIVVMRFFGLKKDHYLSHYCFIEQHFQPSSRLILIGTCYFIMSLTVITIATIIK